MLLMAFITFQQCWLLQRESQTEQLWRSSTEIISDQNHSTKRSTICTIYLCTELYFTLRYEKKSYINILYYRDNAGNSV